MIRNISATQFSLIPFWKVIWFIVLAFLSTAVGPFPALTAAAVLSLIPALSVVPFRTMRLFWMPHLPLKKTPNKSTKTHKRQKYYTGICGCKSTTVVWSNTTELERTISSNNYFSSASPTYCFGLACRHSFLILTLLWNTNQD